LGDPSIPVLAYAVAAAAAAVGSAADLGTKYPRFPWAGRAFGMSWFAIVALDAVGGVLAVVIAVAIKLQDHASWLTSYPGWIAIGFAATLIVRANLLTVMIGRTSVPIGFGLVYGTLRSLCERPMKGNFWDLDFGERDGRRGWLLDRVDARVGSLTLERTETVLRDYVDAVITGAASRDAQKEIDVAKENDNEVEGIKQLVTYMNGKGYVKPLYRLLGRPSRTQVKAWRKGA
jgi:hypothetical protein